MKRLLLFALLIGAITSHAQSPFTFYKTAVDAAITNKATPDSITASDVGTIIKRGFDTTNLYFLKKTDPLLFSYWSQNGATSGQVPKWNGSAWVAANESAAYTLPTASPSTLGGVKVDGTTIVINGSGVISATGGGGSSAGKKINIVFGGDSNTAGQDQEGQRHSWPSLFAKAMKGTFHRPAFDSEPAWDTVYGTNNVIVWNLGRGGTALATYALNTAPYALPLPDSTADANYFLWSWGTNDEFLLDRTAAQMQADADSICQHLHRLGWIVIAAPSGETSHSENADPEIHTHPEMDTLARWMLNNQARLHVSAIISLYHDQYVGQTNFWNVTYWQGYPIPANDYVHYGRTGVNRICSLFVQAFYNASAAHGTYTCPMPASFTSEHTSTSITFYCSKVPGATEYEFRLNKDSAYYETAALIYRGPDTFCVASGLTTGDVYYGFNRAAAFNLNPSPWNRTRDTAEGPPPVGTDSTYIPHDSTAWTYPAGGAWADLGGFHYTISSTMDSTDGAQIMFTNGIKFKYEGSGFEGAVYEFAVDGGPITSATANATGDVLFEVHPNDSTPHVLRIWQANTPAGYVLVHGAMLYD